MARATLLPWLGPHGGTTMSPDEAREAMVERLRAAGTLTASTVERALIAVPRHYFLEGTSIDAAYAETAVTVKRTRDGTAISSISQPAIVVAMLELSELEPGHRVLEIGTGTGYNAALLAAIVGAEGRVVTVELERDLALAARERLVNRDVEQVEVVIGDGAGGYLNGAPYDRIIVTTGASQLTEAWADQLSSGGRLVVPIVDAEGVGTIRCLVEQGGQLEEIATMPCGFLPMRGE